MGSKFSKSSNHEMKIEPQYWSSNDYENSHACKKFDYETYSSSQNDQTKDNTEISSNQVKLIKKTEIETEKEKLFPYKFEYKGLGSSVILTGSFLENWTKYEPMVKNSETEIFEKVEYLTKTKHYFKFIVDNKWVCSNQYQIITDNSNNQNNFIDLTNYVPPEDLIRREEIKKGEIKIKHHRSKVIILDKNAIKKKDYNCKYPLINELNSSAPCIIEHYLPSFNINYISNQNNIKNITKKKYLKYNDKSTLTENTTYKKILVCPHEKLMHFCENITNIKNEKKRYIKACTTVRNKHKYLTVVYYKPIKSEKKNSL